MCLVNSVGQGLATSGYIRYRYATVKFSHGSRVAQVTGLKTGIKVTKAAFI